MKNENATRVPACLIGEKKERKRISRKLPKEWHLCLDSVCPRLRVTLSIMEKTPHTIFRTLKDNPERLGFIQVENPTEVKGSLNERKTDKLLSWDE